MELGQILGKLRQSSASQLFFLTHFAFKISEIGILFSNNKKVLIFDKKFNFLLDTPC
jgi:hypothetical protein